MLSSDEPLTLLVEKLDALARADRAAILRRLTSAQRRQLNSLRSAKEASPPSAFSPALTARLAQLDSADSPLTPAAREALLRAAQASARPTPPSDARRGASLADVTAGLFRRSAGA